MLNNPRGQWGAVEIPLAYIEGGDPREDNGVPQKAYKNEHISDRARFGGEGHIRGETRIIVKRGPAERQAPPGYSGTRQCLRPAFEWLSILALSMARATGGRTHRPRLVQSR